MNMGGDMKKQMAEKARDTAMEQLETEVKNAAPIYMKILFPCCGGAFGTTKKCTGMLPPEVKEKVTPLIEKVDKMNADIAAM